MNRYAVIFGRMPMNSLCRQWLLLADFCKKSFVCQFQTLYKLRLSLFLFWTWTSIIWTFSSLCRQDLNFDFTNCNSNHRIVMEIFTRKYLTMPLKSIAIPNLWILISCLQALMYGIESSLTCWDRSISRTFSDLLHVSDKICKILVYFVYAYSA